MAHQRGGHTWDKATQYEVVSVGRSVHPLVGLLVIDPDQIISHVGLLRLFSSPVASPIVDMMRENIFIKRKKILQKKIDETKKSFSRRKKVASNSTRLSYRRSLERISSNFAIPILM